MTSPILDANAAKLVQAVENVARGVAERYLIDMAAVGRHITAECAMHYFAGAAALAVMEGHPGLAEALRQVAFHVGSSPNAYESVKSVAYG